jgi:hypothetical protein
MPGICTANTSPNACGHRVLTVALDGENFTLHVHNSTLDAETWDTAAKEAFLKLALRRARSLGLSMADALNRVFVGEEATNVKQYPLLGKDVTKTNIGTSYVNIPPGANGERTLIDLAGCTQFRAVLHANLVATGPFQIRIIRDSDSAVFYESPSLTQTGERELDTDWQTLPVGFNNFEIVRLQGKSTTGSDDPIFRKCVLYTR